MTMIRKTKDLYWVPDYSNVTSPNKSQPSESDIFDCRASGASRIQETWEDLYGRKFNTLAVPSEEFILSAERRKVQIESKERAQGEGLEVVSIDILKMREDVKILIFKVLALQGDVKRIQDILEHEIGGPYS